MFTSTSAKRDQPAGKRRAKFAVVTLLLAAVVFLSEVQDITSKFIHRQLIGYKTDQRTNPITHAETDVFKIVLVGVPGRVPTTVEDKFFEEKLHGFLDSKDSRIQVSSVRVLADENMVTRINRKLYGGAVDENTIQETKEQNRKMQANGDEIQDIYQLHLLVSITGVYFPPPALDFKTAIMSVINDGQKGLVRSLIFSTSNDPAMKYFDNLKLLACTGTRYRASVEGDMVVRMPVAQSKSFGGIEEVKSRGGNGLGKSGEREADDNGTTNGETAQVPDTSYTQNQEGEEPVRKEAIGAAVQEEVEDQKNTPQETEDPYNAEAIEFRTVSGAIFLSFCVFAVLWNIVRVSAKTNVDRRKRIALAREAYEIPVKTALGAGKFGNSNKFTGTMDTGTGLI